MGVTYEGHQGEERTSRYASVEKNLNCYIPTALKCSSAFKVMAIVKMQGIKLLLLFSFVCSSQSNTATLCGDPRVEPIVAQCCHLDRKF